MVRVVLSHYCCRTTLQCHITTPNFITLPSYVGWGSQNIGEAMALAEWDGSVTDIIE